MFVNGSIGGVNDAEKTELFNENACFSFAEYLKVINNLDPNVRK